MTSLQLPEFFIMVSIGLGLFLVLSLVTCLLTEIRRNRMHFFNFKSAIMKQNSVWHKRHRFVVIVVTLFLSLSLFSPNISASTRVALISQSSVSVTQPPVVIQSGSVGTSTIYANSTSAKVSVAAPLLLYDVVDTSASNVDSNADIGTHSNFTSQEYGPDSVVDTITEAGSGPATFGKTSIGSNSLGYTGYLEASRYQCQKSGSVTMITLYLSGGAAGRYSRVAIYSDNSGAPNSLLAQSSQQEIAASGWYNFTGINVTVSANVYYWLAFQISSSNLQWRYDTGLTNQHAYRAYAYGSFPSSFGSATYGTEAQSIYASLGDINYQLDLEEQWANVNCAMKNTVLCIKTGALNAENLAVDAWTGLAWTAITPALQPNQWNNFSVSTYLTSSSFTVRFRGTNETTDTTQSSWNIDVSLLRGSWYYRKAITINQTKVGGSANLSDFPVLISMTDQALSKAKSDGGDIVFTSSDGTTKLSHEIEKFNQTSGELVAWVKVPILYIAGDTALYIYYGNPLTTNQQDPAGVWDSNYAGVWHLKEDPSGTAPQMKDSTSNGNNGTSSGSMTVSDQVNAKIDGGLDFDGGNDEITCGSSSSLQITTEITIEAWAKTSVSGTTMGIVNKQYGTSPYNGYQLRKYSNNRYRFAVGTPGSYYASSDAAYTDSNWHHIVGVRRSGVDYLYVDGIQQANTTTQSITDSGYDFDIGRAYATYNGFWWNGQIDEVRVSNIGRSAGWILTEYNNQNSPSTFYSVGSEEPTSYDYVLKCVNQVSSAWKINLQVYANLNIDRILNATISFHDGSTSDQIRVAEGVITQSAGSEYDLVGSATVFISMRDLQASSTGTSYLHVYLKIKVPSTSTYNLYTITFQIN